MKRCGLTNVTTGYSGLSGPWSWISRPPLRRRPARSATHPTDSPIGRLKSAPRWRRCASSVLSRRLFWDVGRRYPTGRPKRSHPPRSKGWSRPCTSQQATLARCSRYGRPLSHGRQQEASLRPGRPNPRMNEPSSRNSQHPAPWSSHTTSNAMGRTTMRFTPRSLFSTAPSSAVEYACGVQLPLERQWRSAQPQASSWAGFIASEMLTDCTRSHRPAFQPLPARPSCSRTCARPRAQ